MRWGRSIAVEVYTRLLCEIHIATRTLERVGAPGVERGVNANVREDANTANHANCQKREDNDEREWKTLQLSNADEVHVLAQVNVRRMFDANPQTQHVQSQAAGLSYRVMAAQRRPSRMPANVSKTLNHPTGSVLRVSPTLERRISTHGHTHS